MEKCSGERIASCVVCGEMSGNESLFWIANQDVADDYDAETNDLIV